MDHTVVDVSGIPGIELGAEALFYGEDLSGTFDIWDAAGAAGTIPWDLLTLTGPRVPRVYMRDGRVDSIQRLTTKFEGRT